MRRFLPARVPNCEGWLTRRRSRCARPCTAFFPGQKPDERHLRLVFVLPCCKHDTKARSLGAQLAAAHVAEARVLQVARAQAPLDLIQLRRLLAHIEPAVNWLEFGRAIWFWGERAKRQFVEDYYLAQFTPAKGAK